MLAVLKSDLGTWKALVVSVNCQYDLVFKSSSRESGAVLMYACMPVTPALGRWGRRMESLRLTWAIHWIQIQHKPLGLILSTRQRGKEEEGRLGNFEWLHWTMVTGWLSGIVVQDLSAQAKDNSYSLKWSVQTQRVMPSWILFFFFFFGENGK